VTASGRKYVVYADGACIGNPGPGGWGVVIAEPAEQRRELSGGPYPATTNNRMEIMAAIEGLRTLEPDAEVILRSDSEYVVKTMTLGWKRNANQDLWRELDREVAARRVRFEWVRGHAGDEFNERADRLATARASGRAAPSAVRETSAAQADESDLKQLESLLRAGESIRPCAGCGRMFVSESAGRDYCSLAQCQFKARRRS
jgi:ribonuclease HI